MANSFNLGLGFSYGENNGGYYAPAYGAPIYGYGAGAGNFGNIGSACQSVSWVPVCNNGCGGGGGFNPGVYGPGAFGPGAYGPSPASIAPPMPLPSIPQNLSTQGMMNPIVTPPGWGAGNVSYPGPWAAPGNCGNVCNSGLAPGNVYAVNSAPLTMPGPFLNSGFSSNASASGIITVGDTNEWEKNDTANIVWATAMGLGMQATNVYPVTCMRNSPTVIAPNFYSTGDRSLGFAPRSHSY